MCERFPGNVENKVLEWLQCSVNCRVKGEVMRQNMS
jgi:hypothetical protein